MPDFFLLEPEYDYNFDVYALNCALKEYHLAWLLNKNLFLNLVKKTDLPLPKSESDFNFFSHFSFQNGSKIFRLIKNASHDDENAFYVHDLLGYDFLFIVKDPTHSLAEKKMLSKLRKMTGIIKVEHFKPEHLKEKENLVIE